MGVGIGAGLYLGGRVHRGSRRALENSVILTLTRKARSASAATEVAWKLLRTEKRGALYANKRMRRRAQSPNGGMYEVAAKDVAYESVCRAAVPGDHLALAEFERSARMLGHGVASL